MDCIVTAGPTFEPLDEVRRLTNFSTGRLGTELANFLADRGHKVTLLVGAQATYCGERKVHRAGIFTTAADLRKRLKTLSVESVDAIFHAAAVSDFSFGKIFAPDKSGKLVEIKAAKKISTRRENLLTELVPTPKIITELRGWFPKTKIIGWKFESDGKRTKAIAAARKQIVECSTDACVANGPAYGSGFGLVTRRSKTHLADATVLFEALERFARE
jgi:phosphopantothenoylcysteine decarboxylase/phosphopantothenate--cysteine ligase